LALSWWFGLSRKSGLNSWRRKRRAVSPVIAELLLIVITVAIGTLVYSFASTAFGGFSGGFSNLVQNAGAQLSENVVVEQAFFYNSVNNNTACAAFDAGPTHCGGVLYVRNDGTSPVLLDAIYIGNVTSPSSPPILTLPSSSPHCSSNTMQPAIVGPPSQNGEICFFTFGNPGVPAPGDQPYNNNLIPTTVANEIMPQQVAIIHFMLPDSSFCAVAHPQYCTIAYGGTTYAFTLVTSRGNEFVAYETA
jgi:flagellin-like protein